MLSSLKIWNPLADESWHLPLLMEKREELKENFLMHEALMREAPVREAEDGPQRLLEKGMRILERTGEFFGGTVMNLHGV